MNNFEREDNILTRKGCKNTKSRQAIIRTLEDAKRPHTAEEIYLKLKEMGMSANLSTIYRTLDLMESKNLVSKTLINEGKGRYELTREVHGHHLVCTFCNRIVPIEVCPIKSLETFVENKTRFHITGHRLELFGICPECQKPE